MKKDKRFIQSEQAIIEASIQTLLRNPTASMSDIATAARVGRATLYRHFESREALIEKLILVSVNEIRTASAPIQHLKGRTAIETYIELKMPLADRFHFLTSLWNDSVDGDAVKQVERQLISELATLVNQAKEEGDINLALPTTWIVSFYESTIMSAWWLIASGDITIDEAIRYTKQSFFNGCGNVKERRKI